MRGRTSTESLRTIHREAITTRPLLLSAIARQTQHAGQVTLTIGGTHAARDKARDTCRRIAGFLAGLRKNAEQLGPPRKWYRILSEALRHFLKGRQLEPPVRLARLDRLPRVVATRIGKPDVRSNCRI
jgi:hypothetical protein